MKRTIFNFLILFFAGQMLFAQQQWERTPGPVGTSVMSIAEHMGKIYAATSGGIFFSSDEGFTWEPDLDGMYGGRYVMSLASNGELLVAATSHGVYYKQGNGPWNISEKLDYVTKVITNGDTFLVKEYSAFAVYRSTDGIHWDAIGYPAHSMATNGDTFFIGGSGGNKLFRSTDNGITWEHIYTQQGSYGAMQGDGSVLMVSTPLGGMLRSTDNGDTFSEIEIPIGNFNQLLTSDITFHGTTIYAGIYAETDEIYFSEDYGLTWQKKNPGLYPSILPQDMIANDDYILAATHQGIYRSTDNGETWSFGASNGIANCEVNGLLVHQDKMHTLTGSSIYGGSFGFYSSADTGQSWTVPSPASFSNNGNVKFGTVINDTFLVKNGFTLSRSTNGGLNWENIITAPSVNMTAILTSGSRVIASTSTDKIFYSDDEGITWLPAAAPFSNPIVNCLSSKGNSLYAGTANGIQKSTDNGSTWSSLPAIIPGPYDVIKMVANDNYIFAAVQSGGAYIQLYRSADDGLTWQNIQGILPEGYWCTLAVNGDVILAGTNPAGADFETSYLYKSTDNGTTWQNFKPGMFVDSDISYLGHFDGKWWAGTEGMGLWSINEGILSSETPVMHTDKITLYPNPVKDRAYLSMPDTVHADEAVLLDVNGRTIKRWTASHFNSGHSVQLDMEGIGQGIYILSIQSGNTTSIIKLYKQ